MTESDRIAEVEAEIRRLRKAGGAVMRHLQLQAEDPKFFGAAYWQMLFDRLAEAGFQPAPNPEEDI